MAVFYPALSVESFLLHPLHHPWYNLVGKGVRIMLDKLSKRILNFTVNTANDTSCFFSINSEFDSEAKTTFHSLVEAVKATESDVLEAVKFLNKNDLVEYRVLRSKTGELKIAFHLTHEGMHFKELKALKTRERWKERILGFISGILVSVIGSLLLTWIP